jgi:polynucleotide 5'-kinase involved in rRNA processing
MSAKSLRDLVKVRGRFHRSVQLAKDARDPHTLDEYVLTPTARDLAQQILASLTLSSGERAWSITGPYGTGKSAFALFLAELLTQTGPVDTDARRNRF